MKLELKNVTKTYNKDNKKVIALDNINFKIEHSGLYLISGRSGSGKTTLLNLISGFDSKTSGEIINDFGDNSISFVFQDFQLIEYLTIYENLKFVCDLYGINYDLILEYAKKYNIEKILNHYPNEVSGGEAQRTAVIRALLLNKTIIVCDEPTGNLDSMNSKIIRDVLKEESKNHIVIVVSHDKEIFESVADRIILLEDGKIISDIDNTKDKEYVPLTGKDLKFSFKNQLFLLSNFIKKNMFKHILSFVILTLTFTISFLTLSTLNNSYSRVLYNTCKDQNVSQIDFIKEGLSDSYIVIPYKELISNKDKYRATSLFYERSFINDGTVSCERTYIADRTYNKMLKGTNTLNDKEILISDYVALKMDMDFESIVGKTIDDNITIVGIYDTGFYEIGKNLDSTKIDELEISQSDVEKQYSSVFMNKNTFEYIMKNKNQFDTNIHIEGYTGSTYVYKDTDRDILYGEKSQLEGNNIGISSCLAIELAYSLGIDISDLIDKEVELEYLINNNPYLYGEDKYSKETYKIKYIFLHDSIFDLVMSEEEFNSSSFLYYKPMTNSKNGYSIAKYNNKKISKILSDGFIDDILISEKIDEGIAWLTPLKYIEAALFGIMMIISIFVIINFVHIIMEKEKSVEGLLTSFGIKKKAIIKMYLKEIFGIMILECLIAAILQIPLIIGFNKILESMDSFGLIYFNPIAILYVFIIMILLLGFVYLVISKQMKKKSVVDIIYHR